MQGTGSVLTVKRKDTLQMFVNQKRPVKRVQVEETHHPKVILLPKKFVQETVQWNQLLLTLS